MLLPARFAPLANILAWQLLPPTLTQTLLRAIYGARPGLRPVIRPDASVQQRIAANERAQTHARRAQALVVAAYLVWSLSSSVQAVRSAPTFYRLLNLDPAALPEADDFDGLLKSAWRRLVRVAHPDVVGPSGEARFRAMRTAYEALGDPTRRDAYERFGESALQCGEKCTSTFAYLKHGLVGSLLFYATLLGVLILVSLTDRGGSASYWRYTCLAAVFALEVRVVLASTSDSPLSWIPVVGALLPWQHIVILHDVFIALSCACGQILPLLRPEAKRTTAGSPADELAPLQPLLDDILAGGRETEARMAMGTRADVQAAFGTGEPHRPGHVEATLHLVRDGALASMVDARVRADEEGAKVWAEAAK